jgi:hypothetical protein
VAAVGIEKVADQMQTGDLILCAGRSDPSLYIEVTTASKYSHVAMVYRHTSDLWLWEEAPAPLAKDPQTGTWHGGAQVGLATDALRRIIAAQDRTYWRPLVLDRTAAFQTAALATIMKDEGVPFSSTDEMIADYLVGKLDIDTGQKVMFCAQLVALTYQALGLLGPHPPANAYSPGQFSEEHKLPLLLGASFGQLVELTVPPG